MTEIVHLVFHWHWPQWVYYAQRIKGPKRYCQVCQEVTGRVIDESVAETCESSVYWWDGEYEGECELPAGHEGPHTDGLSWWDDDGEEVVNV